VVDNTNTPADVECKKGSCSSGAPGYTNLANGTSCAAVATCNAGSCTYTPSGSPIAAGSRYTCAITSAGGVKCWGLNAYGQLGDGTTTTRPLPTPVQNLSSGVVAIATDLYSQPSTCALKSNGAVLCWGRNNYGQVGDGTTTDRYTPTEVQGLSTGVVAISMGTMNRCALKYDGTVLCWGYGMIGDNTNQIRYVPTQAHSPEPMVSVGAGSQFACGVSTAGALFCWGGYNRPLALPEITNFESVLVPTPSPFATSGLKAVDAGGPACALTTSGGVRCWGYNNNGELDNGSSVEFSYSPVNVTGLSAGVSSISVGGNHSCAITSTGAVQCWGFGTYGELGHNAWQGSNVPVQVQGLTSGYVAVSAGDLHSCAYSSSKTVRCWGHNSSGELGDNSKANWNTPVAVLNF